MPTLCWRLVTRLMPAQRQRSKSGPTEAMQPLVAAAVLSSPYSVTHTNVPLSGLAQFLERGGTATREIMSGKTSCTGMLLPWQRRKPLDF